MPKPHPTNAQMCKIVTLNAKVKKSDEHIAELEKMLSRSLREIETLSAQYNDSGSDYLIEKIKLTLKKE